MRILDALSNLGVSRIGTPQQFSRLPGCEEWPAPCSKADRYDECERCKERWRAIMDVLDAQPCDPPHDLRSPTDLPLVAGGQGRSAEELVDDAKTLGLVAGVAIGCMLGLGVAWLWTVLS